MSWCMFKKKYVRWSNMHQVLIGILFRDKCYVASYSSIFFKKKRKLISIYKSSCDLLIVENALYLMRFQLESLLLNRNLCKMRCAGERYWQNAFFFKNENIQIWGGPVCKIEWNIFDNNINIEQCVHRLAEINVHVYS